jgi:hypothetical protein
MAKTKSKAKIMTPDGAGGLAEAQDMRFERVDWPVSFEVAAAQADTWFEYLSAECQKLGWNSSGITQIEAKENSTHLPFAVMMEYKKSSLYGSGNAARRSRSVQELLKHQTLRSRKSMIFFSTSTSVAPQDTLSSSIRPGIFRIVASLGAVNYG